MKTAIALCITFTMLIGSLAVLVTHPLSQNENEPISVGIQNEVLDSETHWSHYLGLYWDDRTIGTLCDKSPGFGYAGVPAQGTITVNNTDFDDSVVMKMDKTVGTGSMEAYYTRSLDGEWRTTFRMAASTTDTTNIGLWLYNDTDMILGFGFDGGKIMVWDGAVVLYDLFEADTWYDFDLRTDTETDTYVAYVNGELVETNPLNPAFGDITNITAWRYKLSTTSVGIAYVDDFTLWLEADYEYQTDEMPLELIRALDYVIDNKYQPNATGIFYGTGPIFGLTDEATKAYPRMAISFIMDAAITAYEITLQSKYYYLATDLGRWLEQIAQSEDGYYEHFGGTGYNQPDNSMTSAEVAFSMIRLYELTDNQTILDSATEALHFVITDCWNSTGDLFWDYPQDGGRGNPIADHTRINFNTNIAKSLAYAYYVTGNSTYRQYAEAVLDKLPDYMFSGDPITDDSTNYSAKGWFAYNTLETEYQGNYELYTAKGVGGAIYYLSLAGVPSAQIDGWLATLEAEIFTLTGQFTLGADLGVQLAADLHNYLEGFSAWSYYALLSNDSIPQFKDIPFSMAEYMTDRANLLLSDSECLPRYQVEYEPDYDLAQTTAIGQLAYLWDWAEMEPSAKGQQYNFTQPYQLTLNSTARILVNPADDAEIEINDISQNETGIYWRADTAAAVTYSVLLLNTTVGYRVLHDGVDLGGQLPGYSEVVFTATGSGEFAVELWDVYESLQLIAPIIVIAVISMLVLAVVPRR